MEEINLYYFGKLRGALATRTHIPTYCNYWPVLPIGKAPLSVKRLQQVEFQTNCDWLFEIDVYVRSARLGPSVLAVLRQPLGPHQQILEYFSTPL